MKLENRIALVTGAGRGIGRAIAERLADEGARVAVNDLDLAFAEHVADKLKEKGREALALKADVVDSGEVTEMFAQIELRFGGVDILVNNAGVRKDVPFHKMSGKDWEAALDVYVKGAFNCARAAQEHMVRQNYGKIVNLASPVPAGVGTPSQTGYATASLAMMGLTRALAVELGPHNINVNCIAPDFIDTDMTRSAARAAGLYVDDYRRLAVALVPLRRLGKPEDVANLVLFLVSDEASFISGQVICVKGGP